ncbi:MAG: isoleucine--tRNA ligase [Clostridia bacterium]
MDYNKTINLPKTDFPMRAGLPTREPNFLKEWEEQKIYEKLVAQNKDKETFILHDGPPYANGNIHMGHALNKILKDFILRYKNMSGFYAPYVPGWDTHGLPIESQVLKTGLKREDVSTTEFRKKCEEFARKYVAGQKEQFKRLGVMGEWDNPYLTLEPEFEAKQIEVFGEMAERGYIYKGLKPVYWCPHCETALAEAEIEYDDHSCTSIYVKFDVCDDNGIIQKTIGSTENVKFVIWTTTTWTLPANVAISLNPFFEYDFVKVPSGEIYVLAKELVKTVVSTAGIENYEILGTVLGKDLENIQTKHPFLDRKSLIIVGEHVTLDAGTGCVHTAPGHGADDFIVCKDYDLPVIVPVNNKGVLTDEAGPFAGMFYEKSNKFILENLENSGALLAKQDLQHSYPHCWRCKNPIIFRATEQWFCSVDSFKEEAVRACQDVKFIPSWGQERIINMVRERNDWCISRQRVWGVPIPIFYCEKCGESIITPDTTKKVSETFAKEGSNAWFDKSAKELLPDGFCCPKCSHTEFSKESDIMDVWFDSGSSHAAVLEVRENLSSPADLYLEGGDQHRGWFQSSLLTSMGSRGVAPYRQVLTHGWVVDGEGKKMSKSQGNVIVPEDVIKQYGADILRLWVSSADYKVDMRISQDMFKQLSAMYLKIRNTARFILGNLDGFDVKNKVEFDDMLELDKWAVFKANELVKKVTESYDNYEFHAVCHAIHHFCVVDMSTFYLDVIKDRLYCEKEELRISAQSAMYNILQVLVGITAPILAFTSDEIYKSMPHESAILDNVILTDFPKFDEKLVISNEDEWNILISIRETVNGALEKMRAEKVIGKSLEATITISIPTKSTDILNVLSSRIADLADLFIVSKVILTKTETEEVSVSVSKCEGEKCERCWIFTDNIGENPNHPTLCSRCASVVE